MVEMLDPVMVDKRVVEVMEVMDLVKVWVLGLFKTGKLDGSLVAVGVLYPIFLEVEMAELLDPARVFRTMVVSGLPVPVQVDVFILLNTVKDVGAVVVTKVLDPGLKEDVLGLLWVGTVVMVQGPISVQVEMLILLSIFEVVGAVVVANVLDPDLK